MATICDTLVEVFLPPVPVPSATASSSSFQRPFRLRVKNDVYTIDSEKLRKLSPIFAVMCFGRDFENGRELEREIVDEKSTDIAIFLNCLHQQSAITDKNFVTILRLATKYQVESLVNACENFVLNESNLEHLKPDEILTLLISSNDYHLRRPVIERLVLQIAREDRLTLNRLKLSRYLPAHLYGGIIATNMNLGKLREHEQMNGHVFRLDRCKIMHSKRGFCDDCRQIMDSSICDGCKRSLCRPHWSAEKCTSDYGERLLVELKKGLIELDYD